MIYLLIPFLAILVALIACLNIKIGFVVAELTESTGFDAGFYFATVVGLFAVEISSAAFVINLCYN